MCSAPQIYQATSNAVHARDIKTSLKCLAPHQFAFLELKKANVPWPHRKCSSVIRYCLSRRARHTNWLPVGERHCRNRESSGLSEASQAALMVDGWLNSSTLRHMISHSLLSVWLTDLTLKAVGISPLFNYFYLQNVPIFFPHFFDNSQNKYHYTFIRSKE